MNEKYLVTGAAGFIGYYLSKGLLEKSEKVVGIDNINDLNRVFNIGNNSPEKLMTFITTLEKCLSLLLNKKVEFKKIYEEIQPGDVPATYSSTDKLQKEIGFKPKTSIEEGLQKFSDWYVFYYEK